MAEPFIETRTPDQLPRLTAISPDALVTVQEEGGPVGAMSVKQLLGRLVQTDTAKETRANLLADLDHDESAVALVFADPDPAKNGWYRKTGVSGAGTWTQFEKLSAFAAAEIAEYVTQASDSATAAASAAAAALAAAGVGEYPSTGAGLAATDEAETFWVDNGNGTGTIYRHDAGPVATEIGRFVKDQTASSAAEVIAGGIPTNAGLLSIDGAAMVGSQLDLDGTVPRTVGQRADDIVSVKEFGATGNGATNDRAAIQAAFDSGAKKVIFPRGRYIIAGGGLTVPDWLHVAGEGYGPTAIPTDAGVCLQFNLANGIALDCGYNPTFENIYFINTGGVYDEGEATLSGTTASCIKLTDNIAMNFCSFAGWQSCIRFGPSPFYIKTFGVEFNRCTNGYVTDGVAPYNVDIYAPISRLTTNFFAGQSAHPARNIKVHGGSIEGYSAVAFGFLDISFFGTYFETILQRAGAFALSPEVNGASVSLFGCLIYMNHTARFVNMSGEANASLTSAGNQFDGAAPAGAICLYLPTSGSVNLSGDRFGTGHPNDATYVDSIPAAAQFNGITFPVIPEGNAHAGYSGMTMVGARGLVSFASSVEPSAKTTGMTVMADGASWDPLGRAAGRPYWVIWQGDRWFGMSGA